MSENNFINLGDLSKPATALIEKISDAVGGLFKPYQIKRIAKAEAEAEIIKTQAQIEVTDLQRRAITRFIAEEAQKQNNIENITAKAIPQLKDSAKPNDIENDWITNFFDKCRIISDEEMQLLWAKVLSGEANSPGTFSRRTVNFLGSLDKADAFLFTSLCGFGWQIGDVVPLIYDSQEKIYNDKGINFNTLTHLDDIGLVSFNGVAGFKRINFPKKIKIYYYKTPLYIDFKNESDNTLQIGKILLTKTGQQLAVICGSQPVDGFREYVMEKLKSEGLIVK